jgi:tRNA (guanosine-2'-O-)-methyltransferase
MTPERFQKIKNILNKRQTDLTVVMDNVNKPHNLAAIIRSCDAVGIGDIHGISSNKQNIGVNLKSACGSNHWVNLHIHHSIPNVISELKQSGFSIYAANGSTKAIDYRKVDYTKPSVIVLGAELDGISPETLDAVDEVIKIPMQGMVESLNVSVANAVILFEAQRQRLQAGLYEKCRLDKNTVEKLLFEFSYPEAAKVYQSKGEPYPELDTEGQIIF